MPFFAVMSPKPSTELAEAVARVFRESYYQVAPGQFLVASQSATTKEIAEQLGGAKGEVGQIIVLAVGSYYGWFTPDVWEWIRVKS